MWRALGPQGSGQRSAGRRTRHCCPLASKPGLHLASFKMASLTDKPYPWTLSTFLASVPGPSSTLLLRSGFLLLGVVLGLCWSGYGGEVGRSRGMAHSTQIRQTLNSVE